MGSSEHVNFILMLIAVFTALLHHWRLIRPNTRPAWRSSFSFKLYVSTSLSFLMAVTCFATHTEDCEKYFFLFLADG